ncbi:MAG: amidohydrolase [Chlorobi bacterium]|nr:amidohydrolase [Chlorobiota bacterium]
MRNNRFITILSSILLFTTMTSCNQKKKADLLIYNAIVYTVNENFDIESAIVVKDGKIVAVGNDQDLLNRFTAKKKLDAGGRPVYPGFNDGHSHFLSYGLTKITNVDLVGTKSFDEVVDRVIEHYNLFPSEWVLGRGWDQNDWKVEEFPTKKKLDEAFPDVPVVLRRIDGHALIANTEAMRRAGIDYKSMMPGGEILLNDKHEPTGVFIDNAMNLIERVIPEPTRDQKIAALKKAQNDCFAVGLTTVTDAGLDKADILLMDSLQKAGELKMRIYAMMNPNGENYDYFLPQGPWHTGRLTVSSIKIYADGALGSRGALLLKPYSDAPGHYGLQLHSLSYYDFVAKKAFDAGFQVCTHAIGDSGNRIILKTYAKYLKGPNDRRWRVEHAQVVDPGDFHYFKDYNIIPSVQTTHCTSDMYWAEERLGKERIKTAYAYKELLEQNGWLINGTDFPVEGISPLKTFYAAVARKDLEGWPEGGFQMENALTRKEALRSITIWPAKGSFDENQKGSIEPGKVADLVILEKDIMQIPESDIPRTKVFSTILNGEIVY